MINKYIEIFDQAKKKRKFIANLHFIQGISLQENEITLHICDYTHIFYYDSWELAENSYNYIYKKLRDYEELVEQSYKPITKKIGEK